jgi:hypothetical protein
MSRIRRSIGRYFVAGLLTFAPIGITIWATAWIIQRLDNLLLPRVLRLLFPGLEEPPNLPFVGVIFTFFVILLFGVVARHLFGREIVRLGERLLSRVPVARNIYAAVKQLFDAIFASNAQSKFRRVVLVEYPRKGVYALAFTTGPARGPADDTEPDLGLLPAGARGGLDATGHHGGAGLQAGDVRGSGGARGIGAGGDPRSGLTRVFRAGGGATFANRLDCEPDREQGEERTAPAIEGDRELVALFEVALDEVLVQEAVVEQPEGEADQEHGQEERVVEGGRSVLLLGVGIPLAHGIRIAGFFRFRHEARLAAVGSEPHTCAEGFDLASRAQHECCT